MRPTALVCQLVALQLFSEGCWARKVGWDAMRECLDDAAVIEPWEELYAALRLSFSKFYESWPLALVAARKPTACESEGMVQHRFDPATEAEMRAGVEVARRTVECCVR
ncbi:MAG: hypothetical protein AAGG08_13000, partial [Actinomycetota bacterium]